MMLVRVRLIKFPHYELCAWLTTIDAEIISLLPFAYKVLTSVLCEQPKLLVKTLIGHYQCGFRPGESTIGQIFTLRQILEKIHEKQVDTHHIFVDPRKGTCLCRKV